MKHIAWGLLCWRTMYENMVVECRGGRFELRHMIFETYCRTLMVALSPPCSFESCGCCGNSDRDNKTESAVFGGCTAFQFSTDIVEKAKTSTQPAILEGRMYLGDVHDVFAW